MAKTFKSAIKPPAAAGFISNNQEQIKTNLFDMDTERIIAELNNELDAVRKENERNKLTSGKKNKRINLMTWPKLIEAAQERAKEEGLSLTQYIENLLICDLQKEEQEVNNEGE